MRRHLGRYKFREACGSISDQALPLQWHNGRRLLARFEPTPGTFRVEQDDDELRIYRGNDIDGRSPKDPVAIFPSDRVQAALDENSGALMVYEVDPSHVPSTTELATSSFVTDERLTERGRLKALSALQRQHYTGRR
jgi:hypothetical protein